MFFQEFDILPATYGAEYQRLTLNDNGLHCLQPARAIQETARKVIRKPFHEDTRFQQKRSRSHERQSRQHHSDSRQIPFAGVDTIATPKPLTSMLQDTRRIRCYRLWRLYAVAAGGSGMRADRGLLRTLHGDSGRSMPLVDSETCDASSRVWSSFVRAAYARRACC